MRYNILIFIALFFGCKNSAQSNKGDLQGAKIINKLTKDYTRIPGTKVYVIIPNGFRLSTKFNGIEKDDNTGITIMDLNGGNFYTNDKNYTKENFKSKGINVKEFYEFNVNGYAAKFASLQSDPSAEAYQLMIGDSTFSAGLMSVFLSNDSISACQIKNCLVSAIYDKNLTLDPFETAKFDIDFKDSKIKFVKFGANVYMCSTNGVDNPDDLPDGLTYIITQLPSAPNYLKDLKSTNEQVLNRMKTRGFTNIEPKIQNDFILNGDRAYKYIGYGENGVTKTLIYNVITGNDNVLLMVLGTAKADFDNNIKAFEDLTKTIKLK